VRVLVVSDVHGNWPALEVVARVPHDVVVCLGDVVGYGPQPGECLRWLRARGALMVQGNHDRALADGVPPRCRRGFEWLAASTADIARRQLSGEDLTFLRELPRTRQVDLDGKRAFLVHATPSDPLYSYLGPHAERWRAEASGVDADLFLVGHTHLPFHLELGEIQVLNPGSLGQPKDGDPRAAYAVIEDGRPRLERAGYPVDRTIGALGTSGVDSAAFSALAALLRTGRASYGGGQSGSSP
jgi:putative phosphoesterase